MKTDTIAAIATAMSNSGIGIVRISGENAFDVADRVYCPKKGNRKVSEMQSHTIHYGYVRDGNEIVDEVLLMVMRSPRSYTTEDTVEIDCHGGTLVMQRIFETVLKNGARPAEPGEFTKRAFLNGRIDLSQAESVIDVINAENDFALKSSVEQLRGSVSEKIKEIRKKILYETAYIESALDDPEHYDLTGYPEQLKEKTEVLIFEIDDLLKSSEDGKILKEGIDTVIVGKPNVGKSSLMNVLVGEERAIVTDIPGTTRDLLRETIRLKGISLNIIDTAGIRDAEDEVEEIGIRKTKESIEKADLVIYVADSSTALDENDEQIISMIRDKKSIVLLNKSDLEPVTFREDIEKKIDRKIIEVSAKEQTGINELEDTIQEMFLHGDVDFNNEVYITNARHKNSLLEAEKSLELVLESIKKGLPEDFYSIDLMDAYESLGIILGESVGEDLINEIFSRFCMGK